MSKEGCWGQLLRVAINYAAPRGGPALVRALHRHLLLQVLNSEHLRLEKF